ncbi:MAG: sigma-70 family RNA polymerase sigma factor [Clostridiales bacterium]|nr:sigma-70 family RNA polymerase sigma factor [Clostridiales bacterium]
MKKFLKKLKILLNKLLKRNFLDNAENILLYICGNEALPLPLEPEEELALLDEVANNNQTAKQKLIEHNLRLVVYIAKKFDNTGIEMEDLISIGAIGLIKAVQTYKYDKKIKLATYASRCIENEILMQLRKMNKIKAEVSLDEPLNSDGEGNELLLEDILYDEQQTLGKDMERSSEQQILWEIINKLGSREKEIMIMRFGLLGGLEKTQKEVADELGISQSYISRLEKKILGKMKKDIRKVI